MSTLPVTQYFTDRTDSFPIDSSDANLAIDIDFRDYTSDAEFEAANTNFDMYGTGSTWSATLGWNGNETNYFRNLSLYSTVDLQDEGTILFEVQRDSIAVAEADNVAFMQSNGTAHADSQYFFQLNGNTASGASFDDQIRMYRAGADGLAGTTYMISERGNDTTQTKQAVFNSNGDTDGNAGYVWVGATWRKDGPLTWIFDGIPCGYATHAQVGSAGAFARLHVASNAGGATPFGAFYIRRMQILDRPLKTYRNNIPVSFFGDSFLNAFAEDNNYATDSDLAELFNGVGRSGKISGLAWLNKLLRENNGFILSNVTGAVVTENGAGYSTEGANQLDATNTNAVIAANPEIIITMGSINDSATAPADLYGDTTGILDTLIDGCSNLRKIYFLDGLPGHKGDPTQMTTARKAIHAANVSANAALDGYRDIVTVVDAMSQFGGQDDYDGNLSQGYASTALDDLHPSSTGHIKMAEIVYGAVSDYLTEKVRG